MVYDKSDRPARTYGNKGPGAILNTISFIGIALGFFLIINRLYWRWNKGTPGIDDIIIIFAWVALIVLGIVTYIAVDYGYGHDSLDLLPQEASDATRMFYLYQIFYKLTINLSKLSILTLYLRVFDTRDWFGKITKFLIFLVVTFSVSIIFANIFICAPISIYWNTSPPDDPSREDAQCINILGYWYASSLYNIFSETVMLFSVLVRIWTLPSHSQPPILQFRQKVNLTVVLGLGVFTIVTAILRVTTLNKSATATDRTGGTRVSTIWSSVEACLALVIANLPMLRQLLRWRGWCGGRWFSSTAGKSRAASQSRQGQHTPVFPYQSSHNRSQHVHPHDSTSSQEIHMQRDFHRQVVTSDASSEVFSDIESQDFRHIEFGSASGSGSQTLSPSKSVKSAKASSKEIKHWGSGSATPSIASTLRSPGLVATEPLPMIRISTDPTSTASSSMHSVRTEAELGIGVQVQSVPACHVRSFGKG